MKNPKIVVTDNRREYRRRRAEHLWEGQVWSDYDKYYDPATRKDYSQIVVLKSRQLR